MTSFLMHHLLNLEIKKTNLGWIFPSQAIRNGLFLQASLCIKYSDTYFNFKLVTETSPLESKWRDFFPRFDAYILS